MTIKRRASSRSEDKTVIFPQNASQQPVPRLAVEMLPQGPDSQLRLGGVEEPDGRAVQVGASHRIPAFDVA